MNEQTNLKKENIKEEQKEMISFSEVDKEGHFKETYGFIEKRNYGNQSFEERIKEMSEKIKKR